jgi:hypothetical protein
LLSSCANWSQGLGLSYCTSGTSCYPLEQNTADSVDQDGCDSLLSVAAALRSTDLTSHKICMDNRGSTREVVDAGGELHSTSSAGSAGSAGSAAASIASLHQALGRPSSSLLHHRFCWISPVVDNCLVLTLIVLLAWAVHDTLFTGALLIVAFKW